MYNYLTINNYTWTGFPEKGNVSEVQDLPAMRSPIIIYDNAFNSTWTEGFKNGKYTPTATKCMLISPCLPLH